MARTALLDSFLARGLDDQGTPNTIATVTVSYFSDGTWDFVCADGETRTYNGRDPNVNALLESMFVGTNGLATGSTLFGNGGANYT